jgi:hypothetical protein
MIDGSKPGDLGTEEVTGLSMFMFVVLGTSSSTYPSTHQDTTLIASSKIIFNK